MADIKDSAKEELAKVPGIVELLKKNWKSYAVVFAVGFILGVILF